MNHCHPCPGPAAVVIVIAVAAAVLPACLPAAPALAVDGLSLNEVMPSNASTIADELGDYDDWIEIVNDGLVAVQLEGLTLTDDPTDPLSTFTFPARTLAPGEYLLVWADGEPGEGALHTPFRLSADGEDLVFMEGTVVLDAVTFPPLGADQSYGRWPDRTGDWQLLSDATPGAANQHSTQSEEIVLYVNEFLALNETGLTDEMGEYEDWVEIYNPGPDAVDMEGLFLTDDLTATTQWAFPAVIMAPGSFLVVFCDGDPGDGPLHAPFRLSGNGEVVGLFGRVAAGNALIDSHAFGPQTVDVSEGREWDGGEPWITFAIPTPGESNGPSAVELSRFEAMVEPGGVRLDWSAAVEVDHLGYALERHTVGGADGYRRLFAGWIRPGEPYSWLDAEIERSVTYAYRLIAVDRAGREQRFGPLEVTVLPGGGGPEAGSGVPRVRAVIPNPSRGRVTLDVDLGPATAGRLRLYDAAGRLVRAWRLGGAPGSCCTVSWDGRDHGGSPVPPGTYFYRLEAAGRRSAGKLLRLE